MQGLWETGAGVRWGKPSLMLLTTFSLAWWFGFSRSMSKNLDKKTALKKYKIYMFQEVYSKIIFRKKNRIL